MRRRWPAIGESESFSMASRGSRWYRPNAWSGLVPRIRESQYSQALCRQLVMPGDKSTGSVTTYLAEDAVIAESTVRLVALVTAVIFVELD